VEDDEDDDADDMCSSLTTKSDAGTICITNNNGHIVIEGKLKSLKVNGKDIPI
jgi:hypothetical protein